MTGSLRDFHKPIFIRTKCQHNHRRYKSGKRQGKAPIELLTGEALEADWVELLIQHAHEGSQSTPLASSPPRALPSHHHEPPTPSQTRPGQALSATTMQ